MKSIQAQPKRRLDPIRHPLLLTRLLFGARPERRPVWLPLLLRELLSWLLLPITSWFSL